MKYQEQGQLLDPHLEQLVSSIMAILKKILEVKEKTKFEITMRKLLFRLLYTLTNVRGYKTIGKTFTFYALIV